MYNELLIAAGETKTIPIDRYNYIRKCVFPVTIELVDNRGVVRDIFDSVTSGFRFECTQQGLYMARVTSVCGQDVHIYSGKNVISGGKEFTEKYYCYGVQGIVTNEYGFYRIYNTDGRAMRLNIIDRNTIPVKIMEYAKGSAFGTTLSTSYFKTINNDSESTIIIESGTSASTLGTLLYTHSRTDYFNTKSHQMDIPTQATLILNRTDVSTAFYLQMCIEI